MDNNQNKAKSTEKGLQRSLSRNLDLMGQQDY